MRSLVLAVVFGGLMTGTAVAQDWGKLAMISSTMGVSGSRVCVGEGSRPTDIGCPSYAPSVDSTGNLQATTMSAGGLTVTGNTQLANVSSSANISVTGNVSANKFIGDGSGITGIAPNLSAGVSGSLVYRDAAGALTASKPAALACRTCPKSSSRNFHHGDRDMKFLEIQERAQAKNKAKQQSLQNCRHVLRIDADTPKFQMLYDRMKNVAGDSNRFVEVLPGHMAFHFESFKACSEFYSFVVTSHIRILRPGEDLLPEAMMIATRSFSDKFRECRSRVHDDAFEARLAQHMVQPLLGKMTQIKADYVYQTGLFLRRSIVRYLVVALYRLLDRPNEKGKTGVTASIESLLDMARTEDVLSGEQIDQFSRDYEKIKTDGAQGEYDLVQAIRDLRNIQVAHSLIPHTDPTDQLWAHHLADFADEVFRLMVELEGALTEATGIALNSLRTNGDRFRDSADVLWQLLVTEKTPAEDVWKRR